MEKLIDKLVEAVERRYDPEPWLAPERTWDSSYGGGDCAKHGRYYGDCYSCRSERDAHYAHQRHRFETARWDEIVRLTEALKNETP
jgi:hypothetical protein